MTFFLLLNIGSIFHQIHYYRVILLSIIGNIREKLINDSFRYESKKKKEERSKKYEDTSRLFRIRNLVSLFNFSRLKRCRS